MASNDCDRDLFDDSSSLSELDDLTMDLGQPSIEEESLTSLEQASQPEPEPEPECLPLATRAYQLEMLEESMRGNLIVAMDTGSGKTHVALLRIMAELERSDKLVFFLVPTVTLANQQFKVIQTRIAAGHSRCISGNDKVDTWSSRVWEAFLLNTRVVVSTYQILLDAMKHGFIRLDQLSLLVVDEAHNCVANNPIAKLMRDFYWVAKREQRSVPHILGLTASPVMKSKNIARLQQEFNLLEQVLDAQCRTPHRHRDELLALANRPDMSVIQYESHSLANSSARDVNGRPVGGVGKLEKARAIMIAKIEEDPEIKKLLARIKRNGSESLKKKLTKAITSSDTSSLRQIRDLYTRARKIERQLGPWAVDYYVYLVMSQITAKVHRATDVWAKDEINYVYRILRSVGIDSDPPAPVPDPVSPKVEALLSLLSSQDGNQASGIIFVLERVTAAVLAHLLSVHPKTYHRFRVGSIVGSCGGFPSKNNYIDLASSARSSHDVNALNDFRAGKKNLIVATAVLEEGIDVPACNFVVCFDPPPNVKVFIQRRGRARARASRLFLFARAGDEDRDVAEWMDLEAEMKRQFENDMRDKEQLSRLECEMPRDDYPVLVGKGTGARLTLDDAKSHLEYFCAKMLNRQFADWRPAYVIHEQPSPDPGDAPGFLLRATVHLPACLAPELRKTDGIRAWRSEAMACKDAAFQAYSLLYRAGLVNENLVPSIPDPERLESRAGTVTVRERLNPWVWVTQAWQRGDACCSRAFTLTSGSDDGNHHVRFKLTLPVFIPRIEDVALFWHPNSTSPWHLRMAESLSDDDNNDDEGCAEDRRSGPVVDDTGTLLELAYGHRWSNLKGHYPIRLVVDGSELRASDIAARGFSKEDVDNWRAPHLIRDLTCKNWPYFYVDWTPSIPQAEIRKYRPYLSFSAPEDGPHAVLKKWPKKTGFLRPAAHPPSWARQQDQEDNSAKPPTRTATPHRALRALPTQILRVDKVPATYAYFGSLIPIITHVFELRLVAQDLLANRMSDVGTRNLELFVTALCSRNSCEATDYERLEFLGDSLLKLLTSINCAAEWLDFPEGYLSRKKDAVVSNARLSRAALEFGLDRYIFNEMFTVPNWRRAFISPATEMPGSGVPERQDETSDAVPPTQVTREMSTKTLADVVEALIGACYTDGGLPEALACIRLFLPEVRPWLREAETARRRLFDQAPADMQLPILMQPVEGLLGYTFQRKALLVEAMTHASYSSCSGRTLDRMEFIGDSILDYIVVTKLFDTKEKMKPAQLHLLRESLVNADVLAFLVMELAVEQEYVEIIPDTPSDSDSNTDRVSPPGPASSSQHPPLHKVHTEPARLSLPLWSFMRHASSALAAQQQAVQLRHAALRARIRSALFSGDVYPWALLARLGAAKYFSDLLESVLGAVWVDSGDGAACERLLEAAGVLRLLRRLAAGGVHLRHPVEELNRRAGHRTVECVVKESPRMVEGGTDLEKGRDTAMLGNGNDDSGGSGHMVIAEEKDVDDDEQEEGGGEFTCKIFISERCVIEATGGIGREEVRTFAAQEVIRIWDTLDLEV